MKIINRLTIDQLCWLMDLIEDTKKSNYKTTEDWWNSEEFAIIEGLDDMSLQILEKKEKNKRNKTRKKRKTSSRLKSEAVK